MARPHYPLSEDALAEAIVFLRTGRRRVPLPGEPATPSLVDISHHLRRLKLTPRRVAPATLARALARSGVVVPRGRRGRGRTRQRDNRAHLCSHPRRWGTTHAPGVAA